MAEFLRRIGDITFGELTDAMAGQLADLESQGRAKTIDLGDGNGPDRWIPAELAAEYEAAFPIDGDSDPAAIEAIVRRYLRTHALVGLAELTARYPIDVGDATDLLERWAAAGGLARIAPADDSAEARWIDPANLDEVRRMSLAIRRRETAAVTPEALADFLTRRQHIHPATVWQGAACLESAIEQFQGYPAAPETWENEILPRRILGYQKGWLDDLLANGGWCWRAVGERSGKLSVAFADRAFSGAWPVDAEARELTGDEQAVLAELERAGARFVADLSRGTGMEPSRVRVALLDLAARGAITNDRFDPLRARARDEVTSQAAAFAGLRAVRPGRARLPRRGLNRPEGRWSVLDRSEPDAEASLRAWSEALLGRYGVLTREIVALDPWAPPWGDLARWLARAEWRGEVRRGYFVEGLSGVQYAHEDAVEALAASAVQDGRNDNEEDVFLAAIDPANVYGSGAPFDIPLLDGGTARFSRIPGNSLVLNAGRPVLIVEASGKRLTGLASASLGEIELAARHLTSLAKPARRVLKIETYNGAAASACPITDRLSNLGFVRDYPGMAYYLGMSG
jgi:ATP-dependent Lhr-like helicase